MSRSRKLFIRVLTVIGVMIFIASIFELMSLRVMAAEKVTSIPIWFSEYREEPGEVWSVSDVTTGGSLTVTAADWSSEYPEWKPAQAVTLSVTVETKDGYAFPNSKLKATASYGDVASVQRKSSSEAVVKINYKPKMTLLPPDGLYLDGFELFWNRADFAGGYEIDIFRDGSRTKTVSVSGKNTVSYNLSSYLTDDGNDSVYDIRMRAVGPKGNSYVYDSAYVSLDEQVTPDDGRSTVLGTFYGSGDWRYFIQPDGSRAAGWQLINNAWYYFDPNTGYAHTGWFTDGVNTYLMNREDAKMMTGWQQEDGKWYYLNPGTVSSVPQGAMIRSGWITEGPGGIWYYLHADGHMASNETVDGYYVDGSGKWRE